MILFTIFAGIIGVLVGSIRNQAIKCQRLEISQTIERNRLQTIIDGLAAGVMITDRNYRIRFMNSGMVREYGEGIGSTCYQHLLKAETPCQEDCKILDVIQNRLTQHWQCKLFNGKTYDITAAPYIDSDGTECQISIFRNTA
jgi:hypothetical protein